MKKILALFLAILAFVSVLSLGAAADEYVLGMPVTINAHNLSGFGVNTIYAFQTETAPTIDGEVSTGEYPGPNNGLLAYKTKGNGLWISAQGSNINVLGNTDYTDLVQDCDVPDYMKIYITYDEEFVYFFVETAMLTDHLRSGLLVDSYINFSQTEDLLAFSTSYAWNRYSLTATGSCTYCSVFGGEEGDTKGRFIRMLKPTKDSKGNNTYNNVTLTTYTDEAGVKWNTAGKLYTLKENTICKLKSLGGGKTQLSMEYRMPLGDVLRITDVEYDDGSPIDFVPEWGMYAVGIRYRVTQKTKDYWLDPADANKCYAYVCSYLPAKGEGQTGAGSKIGNIVFKNTISSAMAADKYTAGSGMLPNPVAFLGIYDPTITPEEYKNIYTRGKSKIVYTTRVTREKNPTNLTSGIRGVNGRVVGAATGPSVSTGDDMKVFYISIAAMVVFAGISAIIVSKKKRNKN